MPLLLLLFVFAAPALAGDWLYVSCGSDRKIEWFSLAADGSLARGGELALEGMPGPLTQSADGSRLFVSTHHRVKRQPIDRLITLARAADGSLKQLASIPLRSRPCYLRLATGGRFLLTASYGAGEVQVLRLVDGVVQAEPTDREQTEQTAHCVELSPDGRFAYVPHTRPNHVRQFRFDPAKGLLEALDPDRVAGPAEDQRFHQPRHLRFHPKQPALALTSNERGGGISSWRHDAASGQLKLLATACVLPASFEGDSAAAEVRIHPAGRFAYVSNRDRARTPAGADTIACVAIGDGGALKVIGHAPSPRFPRSINLSTDGRFLFACGQRDNKLVRYAVDAERGTLRELGRQTLGKLPSWIEVVAGAKR